MDGDEVLVVEIVEPAKEYGSYPLGNCLLDDRLPGMVREGRELIFLRLPLPQQGHQKGMHRWEGQHDIARSRRTAVCTAGSAASESGTVKRRTGIWVTRRWRKSNSRTNMR